MSLQRSEPRSPEDFERQISEEVDSDVVAEYLRERYTWELLSYCTDGLEPRSPEEFYSEFISPLAELGDERWAVKAAYRRCLWYPVSDENFEC